MTTIINNSKSLHKENTIDIFKRTNKMLVNHYYIYKYNYDSNIDIDIKGDNKEHNILFYYYQYEEDNQIKYNYDLVNNNFELYFDKINNNNIKLTFCNGKLIILSNYLNKNNNKKIKFDDDLYCQAKHIIQFGKVKNNIYDIINIDKNLLLNLDELYNSLKNGVISDYLINNGLSIDLFNEMFNIYKTNNNDFNYVKEYYGYCFKLKCLNCHNKNPFIYKNILFCINLNGEIYINFYDEENNEIKINSDIFNKLQDNNYIFKDYFIIPFYEIIYNKYSDLKFINFPLINN